MVERPATIETERFRLVVLLAEEIRALVARDTDRAGQLAGARFPQGWPEELEPREGLGWHLRHLEADPAQIPWRIRIIVERSSGSVVGSVNLKGPPDADGDVEIGWGLVESRRGRGYAFEASSAVLRWLFSQAGVRSVSATVPADNLFSQRLAARLGMALTNERRRGLPVWRLFSQRQDSRPEGYRSKSVTDKRVIAAARRPFGRPCARAAARECR